MLHILKKLKANYGIKKKDYFLRGSYLGLLVFSLLAFGLGGFFFRTGLSPWLQLGVYLLAGSLAFFVFRWIGAFVHYQFSQISGKFVSLILATIACFWLASEMRFSWPGNLFMKSMLLGMTSLILIGSGFYAFLKAKSGKGLYLVIGFSGLILAYLSLGPIISSGEDPYPVDPADFYPESDLIIDLANPGLSGNNEFEYFTYGSGTDIRRAAFGKEVRYETKSVNALPILPEWKGKKKKWRERYWGFGIEEAPLNGRVWMPKKGTSLPLVLIVHGNHGMEHHSDPGYAYLGELLASRGFVTVSVDENFINGTWSGDFRGKEMPARGWFLLKHLEQWRTWNNDPNSELYNKVDLDQVMLIGHSRGGEAVAIAAAFNKLSHFPDDASIPFDFNFGIKGLVAIAPTDARYFRRIELKDINYLSLQGTYDADEASFFGLRQYQRVRFTEDSSDHFKAGVLIHKANHGQFNSIWGRRDFGEPFGWFLNTGALIDGEAQRKAAKVFISAFAERTFNQKPYDPIFEQPYAAKSWLPETVMLGNYTQANQQYLLDYENDIDITNDDLVTIDASDLLHWQEKELDMRNGDTQGTNAAILGWDLDSLENPTYELTLKDSLLVASGDSFVFSMGRSDHQSISLEGDEDIDFNITLIGSNDTLTTKNIFAFKKPAPLLKVKYMKIPALNGSFGDLWELNMETVALPLDSLPEEFYVKKLRFNFDQSPKGVVALDNIGIRRLTRSSMMMQD